MQPGRSDKKLQVAPYIPRWQRELVHDVGRYLRIGSDGEAGRRIVMAAAGDVPTINRLAAFFWRDYSRGGISWIGHDDRRDLGELVAWPHEQTERLKMRFAGAEWCVLDELAFALARPVAHTTAALLTLALRDERLMQRIAPGFVSRSPFTIRRGFYQWGSGRT